MRSFCFLLGAGASAKAGIPLMQEMGEAFRARIQDTSPDLLPILNSVPGPTYAAWRDYSNIETLLFFLYAAADLAQDPAAYLHSGDCAFFNGQAANKDIQNRQKQARLCAILALKACSFILDKTSRYNGNRSYLDPLQSLIPAEDSVDIFSLNYDTVIEDFCADHQ